MTHAKAIFFGEHSVVYGHRGITIPLLEMTTSVQLEKTNRPQERDDILNYIAATCKIDATTQININTTIPVGRGLGSSATLSIATAKAAGLSNLKEIADKCETYIHGNPSGIDVSQVLSNTPLIFSKKDGAKPFNFCLQAYLLIIDTGIVGITKESVSRVKENYKTNKKYIDELGQITEDVITFLENKDVITVGKYMDKAQFLLKKIGVSHKKNDDVVSICKENGALGAKITGGGDGGCCISLSKSKEDAKKIQKSLNEKGYLSWIVTV